MLVKIDSQSPDGVVTAQARQSQGKEENPQQPSGDVTVTANLKGNKIGAVEVWACQNWDLIIVSKLSVWTCTTCELLKGRAQLISNNS